MLRTHTCGELTEKNIGEEVKLCGWVDTVRDHGGLGFIDLRDRYGKTQLVFSGRITDYKSEDCLEVTGKVEKRPPGTENSKISTGKIEISITNIETLSESQPLPFEVTKSRETNEELRMKYRYLDLRNPEVQKNFLLRHRVCQVIRRVLDREGFIEVETPILTKSTPEGARDYLVPSRLNQGEFFALPQSPQFFKQLLMVAGFDRYFQIAKCFRDEDLRADRQPEFTQLDMEMSFLEENDLFGIVEEVLRETVRGLSPKGTVPETLREPFPRLTYQEAMARYGSDKPDLRFGLEIHDASELVKNSEFKVFRDALAKNDGKILGICLPKAADVSRKEINDLTEFVKVEGAAGLAYFKVEGLSPKGTVPQAFLDSPIAKFFDSNTQTSLIEKFKAKHGDLLLLVADERPKAQRILGALRLHAARWKNLVPGVGADPRVRPESGAHGGAPLYFSWITDFPLFKYNEEEKRWESEHHPFTCPNLKDWEEFHSTRQWWKIRSRAYDLVLNGNEIASGSVRIHQKELQKEIFQTIGLSDQEAENRFGFLLKAFEYGAPPHGGIALGIDRVMALLLGVESIREVIAFPKNQRAADPMTEAPSPVSERQLKELGIKIR